MKRTALVLLLLGAAVLGHAQTDVFVARHNETGDGPFNAGRVRINATFDGTAFGQWENRGNAGTPGDGTVWHGFARYKMDERGLFAKIAAAGSITWTTGLLQKEKNRSIDPVNGGHDVDVYLVVDPAGRIVPPGSEPTHLTAWDWANELGLGYENKVLLGRVQQSEPMAADTEKDSTGVIPVDSPAMRIAFDLTPHLKQWVSQGLLTEDSTIAVGLVQRQAQISDGAGNPKFDDPNLYIHSQMVFEVKNAYVKTVAGSAKGPGIFADLDLIGGYVDSASWLGWVQVDHYPWIYLTALNNWAYVTEPAGWVYITR